MKCKECNEKLENNQKICSNCGISNHEYYNENYLQNSFSNYPKCNSIDSYDVFGNINENKRKFIVKKKIFIKKIEKYNLNKESFLVNKIFKKNIFKKNIPININSISIFCLIIISVILFSVLIYSMLGFSL